ncbi:MAG: hypothetical protein LUH04_12510 [Clostridium sp.]|nr:hypothetical protein [Clostridium sp.]
MSKEIKQAFINEMDEKYELVYIGQDQNLLPYVNDIEDCLSKHTDEYLSTVWEYLDYVWEEECEKEIDALEKKLLENEQLKHLHLYIPEWIKDFDNRDQIQHEIGKRDKEEPIKDLVRNTNLRARATLYTNYDCLMDNFDMNNTYSYDKYFKDIIDVLFLNPSKVKHVFNEMGINTTGRFPNKKYREGKEAVLYEEFAEELLNQTTYGLLTFVGMLPMEGLYEKGFKDYKYITIPKGNKCGIFGAWNGGGGLMEMTLQRDLTIPIHRKGKTKVDVLEIEVDEPNCTGYCIDEVYGIGNRSFWNNSK